MFNYDDRNFSPYSITTKNAQLFNDLANCIFPESFNIENQVVKIKEQQAM